MAKRFHQQISYEPRRFDDKLYDKSSKVQKLPGKQILSLQSGLQLAPPICNTPSKLAPADALGNGASSRQHLAMHILWQYVALTRV